MNREINEIYHESITHRHLQTTSLHNAIFTIKKGPLLEVTPPPYSQAIPGCRWMHICLPSPPYHHDHFVFAAAAAANPVGRALFKNLVKYVCSSDSHITYASYVSDVCLSTSPITFRGKQRGLRICTYLTLGESEPNSRYISSSSSLPAEPLSLFYSQLLSTHTKPVFKKWVLLPEYSCFLHRVFHEFKSLEFTHSSHSCFLIFQRLLCVRFIVCKCLECHLTSASPSFTL